jgi:hypothetical protein
MIFLLVKLKFFLHVLQNDIGTKILITSKPYREVIGPMLIALKVCKLVCLLAGEISAQAISYFKVSRSVCFQAVSQAIFCFGVGITMAFFLKTFKFQIASGMKFKSERNRLEHFSNANLFHFSECFDSCHSYLVTYLHFV